MRGAVWRAAPDTSSARVPLLDPSRMSGYGCFLLQGELFLRDAQRRPRRRLRDDPLEGFELDVGDVSRRCPDRRAAFAYLACGIDHDAPELHDRDVARAQPFARTVGDRSHRLPHRDVLIRNALDAGVARELHRPAVLEIVVLP